MTDIYSDYSLINKHEASRLTGLTTNALKEYRLKQLLIKDVHYVVINARVIKYRAGLLKHWADFRDRADVHVREIKKFLEYCGN